MGKIRPAADPGYIRDTRERPESPLHWEGANTHKPLIRVEHANKQHLWTWSSGRSTGPGDHWSENRTRSGA